MGLTLDSLEQIATAIATQFGDGCEVVIHDLKTRDIENSIVFIINGHVTGRQLGDGPSGVVLDFLNRHPDSLEDEYGYLTKTSDGHILKSSTCYIRDEHGDIHYVLGINYDITTLAMMENALHSLTSPVIKDEQPREITHNVNDLLDHLIEESVRLVGKPVPMMTKDDKITAIRFLNESGAFLITKSGDKVAGYFGISKYTLYNYIDVNK